MLNRQEEYIHTSSNLSPMGDAKLYLDKCQVDTPYSVVAYLWSMLITTGRTFNRIVDYGAGDGRFSIGGKFESYLGFEIDRTRQPIGNLPSNAKIIHQCALASKENEFDACIGNPPFVRHHDIDQNWYEHVCKLLEIDLGFRLDRRSNAFLLFLAKALISTKADGLVALVIPFEWVSRPAAKKLREYIIKNKWNVDAYRFTEDIFQNVMTTASLTLIDKSKRDGKWSYFSISSDFKTKKQKYVSGDQEIIEYTKRTNEAYAQRGLSPGGQEIFCLTEGERIHNRLVKGRDVVPCITTMRHWKDNIPSLTSYQFQKLYVHKGMRCWLLKTWDNPSKQLMNYLNKIPLDMRNNYTCNNRSIWWKVSPHDPADIIYSSAFVGETPKFLLNTVKAVAVGTIQGIHRVKAKHRRELRKRLSETNFGARVVAHSGKLRKIEVGQMNSIITEIMKEINTEI